MVHVVEPISETAQAVISAYLSKEVTNEAQKEAMNSILSAMKNRLRRFYEEEGDGDKESGLVKGVHVVQGKPSEEILRLAEEVDCQMIVMGKSTRKVRGIRVMGSTARRVSRMSRVPVLIVPNA
jgi:nucleotide-binding universal stress UspA family protein